MQVRLWQYLRLQQEHILGRDHNLTHAQRHDFEIIRRQYKHIADIITYDDLLRRLNFMLEQLRAGR